MSKSLRTKVEPVKPDPKNQPARMGRQEISPKANFSNINKLREIPVGTQQCSQLTNRMISFKSMLQHIFTKENKNYYKLD